MKNNLIIFIKGMAMGIANVIPGVSGGTIALITGIYEKLVNSLKSLDKKAFSLLLKFKLKEFANYINLQFLFYVFSGSLISLFSIANLFKYLFKYYPLEIWSFFFGLIIASIIFIGRRISVWNYQNIISIILGIAIAFGLTYISPSGENDNLLYVFICGIIGISGMILPGLSGSYILILMGNYELLMVTAVSELNIPLLTVFMLGSILGLIIFSHFLHWLLKEHYNLTLASLTGFIIGSLPLIWPWKEVGEKIIYNGKEKIISYNYLFPTEISSHNLISVLLIIVGFTIVYLMEKNQIK